jgi:DNA-binding LacI/PurR family transcriptional regulator
VVTIQDVARRAGVSNSTVSNVLNGRADKMRKDTLERVESAIAELGFQPNRAARLLKTGHTPLLGLLIPSMINPSYGILAREIQAAAQGEHGYRVLLGSTDRNPATESSFFGDLLSHGARGVIVVSSLEEEGHLIAAVKRGLVPVSYDRRAPPRQPLSLDYVSTDNLMAGRLAGEHLIAAGHRDIAFLTPAALTMSRIEKRDGFAAAAHAAGCAVRTIVGEGHEPSIYGDAAMAELGRALAVKIADQRPRPTGVFAINDMLALGVVAGLRERGLSVPEQVSVIGSDDLVLDAIVSPALTSVRPPFADMARLMVARVVRRLRDPAVEPQEFLFLPSLVARASVAPPAG